MTRAEQLNFLIKELDSNIEIPQNLEDKWNLFRSLVNIRSPKPISKSFLEVQDALLKQILSDKGITDVNDLLPIQDSIYLWRGDITTIKADAIVNAANSAMLGCFVPCHACIDNAIHSYSGVQLRLKCAAIMKEQAHMEETGKAKITPAYNLPSRFVIHTVGPIVYDSVTNENREQLMNSYLSCLKIADEYKLESIVFCCISTGEFKFPNLEAAEIAINTVSSYLKNAKTIKKVVFNVFTAQDEEIYKRLLEKINKASDYIEKSEAIIVGVGSGMTASGGFSYTDPILVQRWYPEYYSAGYKSISQIMSEFWPTMLSENNVQTFWGFWAKHIFHIRYEPVALEPYKNLFDIVEDKNYFICSTNVDGQLEKAGFPKKNIFAPQGDYGLFQCSKPCSDDVYNNAAIINKMIANMPTPFEIDKNDIPICPKCGSLLMPNLRCDNSFVEKPHMENMEYYEQFINNSFNKKLVLLELGVGFNTPGIIRLPFEQIASESPNSVMIRINTDDFQRIINNSKGNILEISKDISVALKDIKAKTI